MPPASSSAAAVLIAAGMAGMWMSAETREAASLDRPLPVAALAWAQLNCDSALSVSRGTPRVQAEDLMRVAARFDAVRNSEGLPLACRRALAAAAGVAKSGPSGLPAAFLSALASLR